MQENDQSIRLRPATAKQATGIYLEARESVKDFVIF